MQDLAQIIRNNARTAGHTGPIEYKNWDVIRRGEGFAGFDKHTGETGPTFATSEQALAWTIGREATGQSQPVGLGIKPLNA